MRISTIDDNGLMEVEFTIEFPPYHMHPGDKRKVSRNMADKLYREYHAIKMPYTTRKFHEGIVMVRAVRPLIRELGKGWYPNSMHMASRELVQKYIDDGSVAIGGDNIDDGGMDADRHLPWYKSHLEWNGQNMERAVICIELAYQCGYKDAHEIIWKWIRDGSVDERGGNVYWEDSRDEIEIQ